MTLKRSSVSSWLLLGIALLAFVACGGSGGKGKGRGGGSDSCGTQGCKVSPDDLVAGNLFGRHVSYDGETIAAATLAGHVYLYKVDGRSVTLQQKIDQPPGAGSNVSVSIDGDVLVIGSLGTNNAFVFRYDGTSWMQEQVLVASDPSPDDQFGTNVDVDDDVIVVGSSRDDDDGENSGSAYVYRFASGVWTQEQKLTASDAAAFDLFGRPVAISGNFIATGAFGNDDAGSSSGSAYVFEYDEMTMTWTEARKLTASDASANDHFGDAIDIDGDVVVVGAALDDHPGSFNAGSAYVYRRNPSGVWSEEAMLKAADATGGDEFGFWVALDEGQLVVGARNAPSNGVNAGAAYVYQYDAGTGQWNQTERLSDPDAEATDQYGFSVATHGDIVVVGASQDNDRGMNSGVAWVYEP